MSEETITNNESIPVDADWHRKIDQLFDEIDKSDKCLTEPDSAYDQMKIDSLEAQTYFMEHSGDDRCGNQDWHEYFRYRNELMNQQKELTGKGRDSDKIKYYKTSVTLGWLYENVAYLLINDGEPGYVHDARNFLIEALDVYEDVPASPDYPEVNSSVRKHIIQSRWLLAITYKQEGDLAKAREILSELLPYAEEARREYGVPYSDSELLPRREIAIIDDDLDEFDKLVEDEPLYSDNAREHFFTLRRCFEAYCFNCEIQKAEAIKPALEESYELIKGQLEPVYCYALKFDEFFYYWASGQTDSAEKLYQEIYPEMCERHFTRYATALCKAHTDMLEGRRIESSEYDR